jgi:hypothetical protein
MSSRLVPCWCRAELSCLISDSGSQHQLVHPDTSWREERALLPSRTLTSLNMGPMVWIPNTHTEQAHAQFKDKQPNGDSGKSPKDRLLRTALAVLPAGCWALCTLQVLHCGNSHNHTS